MMLRPLAGLRVGVLQTRYAGEFASLIERVGGIPVVAPCLREVRVEDAEPLRQALHALAARPVDVFVFQTGVGTSALLELASELGLLEMLAERIRSATVVARGPKPLNALLKHGFKVDRRTPEPHTTAQLTELLDAEDLDGRRVAIQHYGSINSALLTYLAGRGAEVVEFVTYRWAPPEDVRPILDLLDLLAAGRLAVTAFTSAAQVENLFAVAADSGRSDRLPGWLNERTITAAIGPTCSQALEEHGVQPRIKPERPKMLPFVRAIAEHFSAGGLA